jgi:uncharacterized membrane protein
MAREIGSDTVGLLGQMFDRIPWAEIGYAMIGFAVLLGGAIVVMAVYYAIIEPLLDRWRQPD